MEPKLVKPKEYYESYLVYCREHLVKGLELWNSNIIKREIIPKFEIDKSNLYQSNDKTTDDWTEEDFELAENTYKKFVKISYYPTNLYHNSDIPNLLMAIAVECVLKGFLLYNGYIIHEHKRANKLTKIGQCSKKYSEFTNEVYSIGEFLKFHVLEKTLPWESKENRIIITRNLEHLKKLRDRQVHLAIRIRIFQIYDMLLFKTVDDLMNKVVEILDESDHKSKNTI